jgi:hypothetical protein
VSTVSGRSENKLRERNWKKLKLKKQTNKQMVQARNKTKKINKMKI